MPVGIVLRPLVGAARLVMIIATLKVAGFEDCRFPAIGCFLT